MSDNFESEINPDKIEKVEMVVCIPSYNEADSINISAISPMSSSIAIIILPIIQGRPFSIPPQKHQKSISQRHRV
jgi:hypothetical protein